MVMKAPGAPQYNPGWHEALAMRSLLVTSEAVARCALMREESRGGHFRSDFPAADPKKASRSRITGREALAAWQALQPDEFEGKPQS